MDVFPAMFSLHDRFVLLIGGGEAAARKLTLLAKTCAEIRVFAPEFDENLRAIAPDAVFRPHWPSDADLTGAALAFVALEAQNDAEDFSARLRAAQIPVNVVDRPALSDFQVPALLERGELVIAVSSGGMAPMLARDVRARIERAIPQNFADLARLAQRIHTHIRASVTELGQRRRLWERILRGPAAERALAGDVDAAETLAHNEIEAARSAISLPLNGVVHIVGAGPGDPELLTLKALRVLQEADLIVYDRLVDERVLDLARRDARRIFVGKKRAAHSMAQDDIASLLIGEARQGLRVVRLKGGDPFIFGRGGEELSALRAAGIETHIVPGITAALGCAAQLGVALTHRDYAQAVTFITGHAKADAANGLAEPDLDWQALRSPNHTIVIYMGAARAELIVKRLIQAGRSSQTPALLVENGTRTDQRAFACSLLDLPALIRELEAQGELGPSLLVIGEAARQASPSMLSDWARQAEALS